MTAHRPIRYLATVLVAALLVAATAPVQARGGEAFPDPFEDARFIPSSVTQYFCFVDAGESLSELLDSSLAPGLKAFYERCESGQSWRELADATGIESSKLFDMLVRRRVTLVTDQPADGKARGVEHPDYSRWVLMASVDEPFARELLGLLNGRVREFVGQTPVYAAERGSLRFAYRDERFYLAATDGEPLLRLMLAESIAFPLADDDEFREARRVGPGEFGMFKRGAGDLHWQAGSAKIKRDRMYLNFVTKHEPRHDSGESSDAINLGLLGTLSENAIYVGIERTPVADARRCAGGPGLTLLPLVPIARARPEVLDHLGPTMFTVIEAPPEGAGAAKSGVPAMTIGIEMRQPEEAVGELDEFMGQATARLSRHRRDRAGLASEAAPAVSHTGVSPEALRTAEWHGAGLPTGMLGLSGAWPQQIVWSSVHASDRAWWVASTDPDAQSRVTAKLRDYSSETCNRASTTKARGSLFGAQVAALISQWPAVTAETKHPLLSELYAWRELLGSVRDIRWRVTQIAPDRTEAGISIAWSRDCRDR